MMATVFPIDNAARLIEAGEGAPHIRPKIPETFVVDAPDLLIRDVAPRPLTLHILPPLQRSALSRRVADVICVVRERPWQRCRIGAITLRDGTRYELSARARTFGLNSRSHAAPPSTKPSSHAAAPPIDAKARAKLTASGRWQP